MTFFNRLRSKLESFSNKKKGTKKKRNERFHFEVESLESRQMLTAVVGTGGDDVLEGGFFDDEIRGKAGNDVLIDDFGDDLLRGGKGNDELFGGRGDDELRGGGGNDLLDRRRRQ